MLTTVADSKVFFAVHMKDMIKPSSMSHNALLCQLYSTFILWSLLLRRSKLTLLFISSQNINDVTQKVADVVMQAGVRLGLCHIFMQHTSASVIFTENADRSVHDDLERFMQSMVPDSNQLYRHDSEGPDDMPSHIRSVLTSASLSIPVSNGQLALGVWQGIYLWEHRVRPHNRTLVITVYGIEWVVNLAKG